MAFPSILQGLRTSLPAIASLTEDQKQQQIAQLQEIQKLQQQIAHQQALKGEIQRQISVGQLNCNQISQSTVHSQLNQFISRFFIEFF